MMPLAFFLACAPEVPGIVSLTPDDGAERVPLETAIQVTLSAETAREVSLWGDQDLTGGQWVSLSPGESDALTYTFQPSSPLHPGTAYTVQAQVEDGEVAEATFETFPSMVGDAVAERVYRTDIFDADITWLSPPELPSAALLKAVLDGTVGLLMMPTRVGDGTLDLRAALAKRDDDDYQADPCVSTVEVTGALFDDPYLSVGPIVLDIADQDGTFSLSEVTLDGHFIEDGAEIGELTISGLIDGRQFTDPTVADSLCVLSDSLGSPCEPCADQSDDETPACVRLEWIEEAAEHLPGATLPAQDGGC